MKRRTVIQLIALAVLSGVLLVGCYVLKKPPIRACPINSLVMTDSGFPGDSKLVSILSPLASPAWESAGTVVGTPDGTAVYDIYRYRTSGRANEEYWKRRDTRYPSKYVDWQITEEIEVKDLNADEFYLAIRVT